MADYTETYESESDYSTNYATSESEDEDINLAPYQFEPVVRNGDGVFGDQAGGIEREEGNSRLSTSDWCLCDNCSMMDTNRESLCCSEIDSVRLKIDEYNEEMAADLRCITQHPGFRTVCLDRYVLETAYFQYRQQYGELQHTHNEQQRYVAYRQLARWCWGYLGKEVRVVLPSCAVSIIRRTFPSRDYKGFSEA